TKNYCFYAFLFLFQAKGCHSVFITLTRTIRLYIDPLQRKANGLGLCYSKCFGNTMHAHPFQCMVKCCVQTYYMILLTLQDFVQCQSRVFSSTPTYAYFWFSQLSNPFKAFFTIH